MRVIRVLRPTTLLAIWFAILTVTVGAAGCSQTPIVLPSQDLDRPTDMAWTCMGVFPDTNNGNAIVLTGQPMDKCHPSGIQDPNPGAFVSVDKLQPGSAEYRTYAYVANSGSGDLSVVDMSYCYAGDTTCWPPGAHLVDLDRGVLGYSAAPLGLLPEVVSSSQDGCRIVSANRGSCDLTLVDPTVLLAPQVVPVAQQAVQTYPSAATQTILPRTDSGYLNVAPGEIVFVPQRTDPAALPPAKAATMPPTYCAPSGTYAPPVGAPSATDDAPVPWRAVVTFPSCDLVALIELPSGTVLDSYHVSLTPNVGFSYTHTGRNPVCPVADCAASGLTPPDAGSNDATGGADASVDATDDAAGEGGATTDDAAADGAAMDDGGAGGATGGGSGGTTGGGTGGATAAGSSTALNVSALAIHPEGNRVYFGATNATTTFLNSDNLTTRLASVVGSLDIVGDTLANGTSTELHQGADPVGPAGVLRVRLSVDPFAYSKGHDAGDPTRPQFGRFVAGPHDNQPSDPLEFLYVIARDGTLRVVNVAGVLYPGTPAFECDLGVNSMNKNANTIDGDDSTRTSCFRFPFPYDPIPPDPTAEEIPPRLPFSTGPGIRFGSPPQDVAFGNYYTADLTDLTINESAVSGAFAFVLTNAGSVYILNLDPELRMIRQIVLKDPADYQPGQMPDLANPLDVNNYKGARVPESPRPLTHSLRDANVLSYTTSLGPQSGPPRLDTIPAGPTIGPSIKAFQTRLSAMNPLSVPDVQVVNGAETFSVPNLVAPSTYVVFPSLATVTAQQWAITWEGDLTGVRSTGDLGQTQDTSLLTDNGVGFCGLDALVGDVLTFTGCADDSSCRAGTVCRRGNGVPATIDSRVIPGLCLDENRVSELLLDQNCGELLKTFMRYEITIATDLTLTFRPKKDEVPRPVYTGATPDERVSCMRDSDCQPDMDVVHQNFKCLSVSALDTITGHPSFPTKRCLQRCGVDENGKALSECRQGRLCVDFGSDGNLCAEAPPITAATVASCLGQLVPYKLSVGNTFLVSGSASGHPEIVLPSRLEGSKCIDTSSARLAARIRMNSTTCTESVLNEAGDIVDTMIRDTTPDPNPCFLPPVVPTMTSTGQTPTTTVPKTSAFFQNGEVRFVLADLDSSISVNFQIRFDVHGGTAPQLVLPSVDANPGLPARIMVGPVPQPQQTMPTAPVPTATSMMGLSSDMPYLYVVDQRQLSGGRVIGRGQVLRITPRVSDTAPIPAYEGYAAGGKYFPIQ